MLTGMRLEAHDDKGKSLAVEWSGFGRVNTVSPGYIKTETLDFADDDVKKVWKDRTVMG